MIPPTVLTLLAADRVVRSRVTGRHDRYGVFNGLNLALPTYLTFVAFYSFTNCLGAAELDVLFVGPDDVPLARGPVHIPAAADPLNVVTSCGTFEAVRIDRSGTYRLRSECGGEVLGERPVLIGPGVRAASGSPRTCQAPAPAGE